MLLVYLPALDGPFLFDDLAFIVNNPVIQAPDGLWRIWFSPRESSVYWPVSSSVLWAEWHVWGTHTLGYHVVNVLAHALNAVLLARALTILGVPGAVVAALLFAFHPMNVEAVAWILQIKTTLSFGFFLCAFLAYATFEARHEWRWYGGALVLFLLALLSKTSAAPLPAVLLGLHGWRGDRRPLRAVLLSLPFFALAIGSVFVSLWFERHGVRPEEFATHLTWPERLIVAGRAFWFYLGRMCFPAQLALVYPKWGIDAGAWHSFIPFAALLLLAATTAALRKRPWGRPVFAATAYLAVMLVPVLGFTDISYMRYSFVADHWAYAAMPSVVAWVVGGAVALGRRMPRPRRLVAAGQALAGAAIALCVVQSWFQASLYRDSETIWLDTLRKNPGAWVAHYNLAVEYHVHGRIQPAVDHYLQAIALKPDYARAEYNLGVALSELGRPDEAIPHYRRAIAIRPDYPRALSKLAEGHLALAQLLFDSRQIPQSMEHVREALRLRPGYARSLRPMAWRLAVDEELAARDPEMAVALAEAGLRQGGEQDAGGWMVMAAAFGEAGRFPEAQDAVRRARALAGERADPGVTRKLDRMAATFSAHRRYREKGREGP